MGKYTGSWAKGFASTFDPVGGMNLGLQWKEKKAAQKKIDDAVEQLKLNSSALAAKFDAARADGTISQQEFGDAMSWAIPLGKEIMGKTNDLYANYQNMTPDQLQTELDNINAVLEFSKDLDFTNLEQMKEFGNKLTQPKAKMQWDLIIKSIENRKQVQPEVFTSPEEVMAKYPDSGYTYSASAGGYVPTFQKEEVPTTGIISYNEKRFNWKCEQVRLGNMTVNQLIESEGVKISPEKATGLEKQIQDIKAEGQRAGIDPAKINKAIQDKILGSSGTTTPTSFKTLEAIKDSFKNVKTKAEYDSALQSYNSSKEAKTSDWTPPSFEGQLTDLIKEVESAIWSDYVNKDGKLKSKGDAEEYNTNLQHYLRLIEEAEREGIDVSRFQAFIPYKALYYGAGNPLVTSENW